MQNPWFYEAQAQAGLFQLGQESFKHAVQVLRLRQGDPLVVTNGQGLIFLGEVKTLEKKAATVWLEAPSALPRPGRSLRLAVSPLKNAARFEWLIEKAGELGVEEIVPLQCDRTVKAHLRPDRLQAILVSAMLQSQQAWLTRLAPLKSVEAFMQSAPPNVLIAHCGEGDKPGIHQQEGLTTAALMIGPEGDFTPREIDLALANGATAVSLGETRLRTETAAIAGLAVLRLSAAS